MSQFEFDALTVATTTTNNISQKRNVSWTVTSACESSGDAHRRWNSTNVLTSRDYPYEVRRNNRFVNLVSCEDVEHHPLIGTKLPDNMFENLRHDLLGEVTDSRKRRKLVEDVKKKQLVESLIWFTRHIPQAVMEDLVSHEIRVFDETRMLKERQRQRRRKFDEIILGDNPKTDFYEGGFEASMKRIRSEHKDNSISFAPKSVAREGALLFVDISGFTKLSTLLDAESLSKVINSYFDLLVSEVIEHGGDILKFAGDAFIAEWRIPDDQGEQGEGVHSECFTPLESLNASLYTHHSHHSLSHDSSVSGCEMPRISLAVLSAAKCAAAIVAKYSDYTVDHTFGLSDNNNSHPTAKNATTTENAEVRPLTSTLNLHCGIGAGKMTGLHVGDCKGNKEEDEGIELRREFIILGDPVNQVSEAAAMASDGEVYASPEALRALADWGDNSLYDMKAATAPNCIASREKTFFSVENSMSDDLIFSLAAAKRSEANCKTGYETRCASFRKHCLELDNDALAYLHLQIALYVHPVIREDELAQSAAMRAVGSSTTVKPTHTIQSRHLAEAEIRSVYTMFIKALLPANVSGVDKKDQVLYTKLNDIMHVTSRELDRYTGHLRQFIVDDKGVVIIATFGLRGSTSPNMISNNCLPATFEIQKSLKSEVGIETRIGATFGKVYCGVVGGIRRHEFAVMGAPVNLAARLMCDKTNTGILVDEAVRAQADVRYTFRNIQTVQAKGYDKPVAVAEPVYPSSTEKKKSDTAHFVGRSAEIQKLTEIANSTMQQQGCDDISRVSTVALMGDRGMGKTALGCYAIAEIKKQCGIAGGSVFAASSIVSDAEQGAPLSSFKKLFSDLLEDFKGFHVGDMLSPLKGFDVADLLSGRDMMHQSSNLLDEEEDPIGIKPVRNYSAERLRKFTPSEISDMKVGKGGISEESTIGVKARRGSRTVPDSAMPGTSLSFHSQNLEVVSKPNCESSTMLRRISCNSSKDMYSSGELSPRSPSTGLGLKGFSIINRRGSAFGRSTGRKGSMLMSKKRTMSNYDKLCLICDKIGYSRGYADVVGSRLFNREDTKPLSSGQRNSLTEDEIAEFLTKSLIYLTDTSDLTVLFIDDLQSVDSFSWKVLRELGKRGKKMMLIYAMRLNDKKAIQRLTSSAASNDTGLDITEMTLGPLDFLEVQKLIAEVLDSNEDAVDEILCADIYQRTLGLPLHAVELLEKIKGDDTVVVDENGMLRWTPEAAEEQKLKTSAFSTVAVMEQTFQSHFDALDVRVRKVLQTCAVLGLAFSLSGVVRVHPEFEALEIESALENAVGETILVENLEDSHENSMDCGDRSFAFSHPMWRERVLKTMLNERKAEIHRYIAEEMEKDQELELEQKQEISRLLSLFAYWKHRRDFREAATLALTVGEQLEGLELIPQSLELYSDALAIGMTEIVQLQTEALSLVLRLHINIGRCQHLLGNHSESILVMEAAYKMLKTKPDIPESCRSLMMPVISTLCNLKLEQQIDNQSFRKEIKILIETFVTEAKQQGTPVHICRALSMASMYFARQGEFERAIEWQNDLEEIYDVEKYSEEMVEMYGFDYAVESICESVQWYYVIGQYKAADRQANTILENLVPLQDPSDVGGLLLLTLPVIQVLKSLGKVDQASSIFNKVVDVIKDNQSPDTDIWVPLLHPLSHLLDVAKMNADDLCDTEYLTEVEDWVLADENSVYNPEHEHMAHTWMGELCCRLASFKDEDDPRRPLLLDMAQNFLTTISSCGGIDAVWRMQADSLLEQIVSESKTSRPITC